jgi:hypothetical protein
MTDHFDPAQLPCLPVRSPAKAGAQKREDRFNFFWGTLVHPLLRSGYIRDSPVDSPLLTAILYQIKTNLVEILLWGHREINSKRLSVIYALIRLLCVYKCTERDVVID